MNPMESSMDCNYKPRSALRSHANEQYGGRKYHPCGCPIVEPQKYSDSAKSVGFAKQKRESGFMKCINKMFGKSSKPSKKKKTKRKRSRSGSCSRSSSPKSSPSRSSHHLRSRSRQRQCKSSRERSQHKENKQKQKSTREECMNGCCCCNTTSNSCFSKADKKKCCRNKPRKISSKTSCCNTITECKCHKRCCQCATRIKPVNSFSPPIAFNRTGEFPDCQLYSKKQYSTEVSPKRNNQALKPSPNENYRTYDESRKSIDYATLTNTKAGTRASNVNENLQGSTRQSLQSTTRHSLHGTQRQNLPGTTRQSLQETQRQSVQGSERRNRQKSPENNYESQTYSEPVSRADCSSNIQRGPLPANRCPVGKRLDEPANQKKLDRLAADWSPARRHSFISDGSENETTSCRLKPSGSSPKRSSSPNSYGMSRGLADNIDNSTQSIDAKPVAQEIKSSNNTRKLYNNDASKSSDHFVENHYQGNERSSMSLNRDDVSSIKCPCTCKECCCRANASHAQSKTSVVSQDDTLIERVDSRSSFSSSIESGSQASIPAKQKQHKQKAKKKKSKCWKKKNKSNTSICSSTSEGSISQCPSSGSMTCGPKCCCPTVPECCPCNTRPNCWCDNYPYPRTQYSTYQPCCSCSCCNNNCCSQCPDVNTHPTSVLDYYVSRYRNLGRDCYSMQNQSTINGLIGNFNNNRCCGYSLIHSRLDAPSNHSGN